MKSLNRLKRTNPPVFWLSTSISICLLISGILWITPMLSTSSREKAQKNLAWELGVRIDDYPYPLGFPSGYFGVVLKPGMSISDVHKIVRAYRQVLHCGDGMEVYYYLSTDIEDTERFFIFYDEQGRYLRIQGEDNDSRMNLDGLGCSDGLLEN